MVLSLLLVELMISELWGTRTSLAGRYRTSVPSNSDSKPGFKALEALIILLSGGSAVISRDNRVPTLLVLWGCLLMWLIQGGMEVMQAPVILKREEDLAGQEVQPDMEGAAFGGGEGAGSGMQAITSLPPITLPHAEPCSCLKLPVVSTCTSTVHLHFSHGWTRLVWPVIKPCCCLA